MSQDRPEFRSFPLRHRLISTLRDMDVKGIRWLAHRLPGFLLPEPEGRCIMKTLHGFRLAIDPVRDRGVERSIYDTGTYEKGSLAIMKRVLRKGDTFVDVGANIGLMSMHASALVGKEGKVFAFEPHPETAAILRENIILNEADNIMVSESAVGREAGKALIYEGRDANRGSASLVRPRTNLGIQAETASEGYGISVTTLAAFFPDTPSIRLIKLDIEGYELEALQGAGPLLRSPHPPILMVECSVARENAHGYTTDALWDFLSGLGHYRIFKARKDKSRVSGLVAVKSRAEMPAHDNIYCLTGAHAESMATGSLREAWK